MKPIFVLNPGTGPILESSREQARANLPVFLKDAGYSIDEVIIMEPNEEPTDGRYRFNIQYGDRMCRVYMPGLPLERVRYTGSPGQFAGDFPRLYIDHSSWLWQFAVNAINWSLKEADTDIEDIDIELSPMDAAAMG